MKILVTGAVGFLGTKIMNVLKNDFELIGTDREGRKGTISMDITKKDEVSKIMNDLRPDVVIHAAAMSNVEGCEEDREKAERINVVGTKNIVESCKEIGVKVVYISTDFVFDGEKGDYKEDDAPNPLSNYAKTKLDGEEAVKEGSIKYIIIRPEVLYGYNGDGSERSFVNWAHLSLKDGKEINVVDDQFSTPTFIDDLAEALKVLIKKQKTGIFHVAGPERLSKHDIVMKIAEVFDLDKSLIKRIKTSELKQKAQRPKDSSLNTERLKKEGIVMHNIEQGLKIMKQQMGC